MISKVKKEQIAVLKMSVLPDMVLRRLPLSSKKIFEASGMRWKQKIHSYLKTHRLNAIASPKQGYQWLHKRPPYTYTKAFLPSNGLKSLKSKFANTQFWVQLERLTYGLEKQSIRKSRMDIKPSLVYLPCESDYYICNLLRWHIKQEWNFYCFTIQFWLIVEDNVWKPGADPGFPIRGGH